ncbi:MAG: ABC transporter permease [Minwuia sp.]|nr:ABC transporter permease [Minwuia sp.]
MPRPPSKGRLVWILSLGSLLALWVVAAALTDPLTLPGPGQVFAVMAREAASGELFLQLGVTLYRVLLSFVLAMSLGIMIGLWMGLNRSADRFLDLWLVFFLNLPALVVMILAYVWLGLTEVAAILAVTVNKVPNVVVTVREGARALDPKLAEMARVFRFTRGQTLRHVILPQMAPFLAAAARSGIALIWKIVLVVELLGRGSGVGFKLHLHFQLFEIDAILAYALAFIAVMQIVEWGILRPLERRANRWRHA